jgi:hypothetical protein
MDSRFSKSIEINHIEIPFLDLDLPIFVSFEEEIRLGREEKEPMMEFSIRKYRNRGRLPPKQIETACILTNKLSSFFCRTKTESKPCST